MMKKNISVLILSLIIGSFYSVSSHAQNSEKQEFNNQKTEVNIAVANIFARNNYVYPYYFMDISGDYFSDYYLGEYYARPELVVGVKFHSVKGAVRLGANLSYSNMKNENKSGSNDSYTAKNFRTTFNMGYEWHLTFSRVNIFYGADLSTSISILKTKYDESNYDSENKYSELTVGINPLLGVNYYITPNLSIGTEVKYTIEYITGKTTTKNNSYNSPYEHSVTGLRTRVGPLGFLSVNIHF
jgi:hypothetical protein